jgi:flagellin
MNAINAVSNQTNVTASHDSGKLVLTAKDGSDIVVETLNDSEDETGLGDDSAGGAATQSNYGKITLESDKTVAITGNTETAIGATADQTLSADSALNSINVTTRAGAESAIKTTDAALKQIDTIRSQIGSTQNQLESTVRNISVTQVNVTAAESTIRDVDFAAESANLQKHNILAQSGVYAMSQANSAQQNVMRLLQ